MIVFFVDFRIKQTWRRKTENSQKPYSESTQFLERKEAYGKKTIQDQSFPGGSCDLMVEYAVVPAKSQPTKELRHNSLAIEHHMSVQPFTKRFSILCRDDDSVNRDFYIATLIIKQRDYIGGVTKLHRKLVPMLTEAGAFTAKA
ncbi:unnamed protein product [Brassica rapa]|uniref:Uncharacterized protein n=2 Tax=Brassica TaxID=3705 RepID=A0A8D9DB59_BRACM|nr:unnamed protein product [Brassica napus]CAF2266121.1 unnamed protein product [Brassica napus]CAG7872711.1 unnamed protein product [Brassica rapa]